MDQKAFKAWMKQVDRVLLDLSGFDHLCLSDYMYADAFEDEMKAEDVALEVLEKEGFPLEELDL